MNGSAISLDDESTKAANGTPLQLLQFTVGKESYAVRIDVVREILEVTQITAVPLMPAFLCGVMNLRGAVVPVVDLSLRLGFDPTVIGRRSCIVVVSTSLPDGTSRLTGMLVDSVQEVFTTTEEELEPVPKLGIRIHETFARSIVRARGRTMTELAMEGLLEQSAIASLIAEELKAA